MDSAPLKRPTGAPVPAAPNSQQFLPAIEQIERAVASVVVDQVLATRLALAALLCGGHALIEDVPGVGKTTLARTLAWALGVTFARIQGTTDLMPSEITGVSVWNAQTQQFVFHQGPLFAQILLFDELNRATPKTQSALLEAMEERQVTVDGVTHPLPRPFTVLATQNPIDFEGTFPLTEAQRDRFLFTITLGYPSTDGAQRLLDTWLQPSLQMARYNGSAAISPAVAPDLLPALFAARAAIHLDVKVRDYIIALAQATREHADVRLGLSPRATLLLAQATQAWAMLSARDYVTPDDVKAMIRPLAIHRLLLHTKAELGGREAEQVIAEIVQRTPAPAWPAAAFNATGGTAQTGHSTAGSRPLPGIRR
jgi:MoxR-like ATPase